MRHILSLLLLAGAVLAQTPALRPVRVTLTSSGTDTYAGTAAQTITEYEVGQVFMFVANHANTGAASLNVDTVGALTIVKLAGGTATALADNDIRSGQPVWCWYDGTNCQMLTQLGNAATGGATTQERSIFLRPAQRNKFATANVTNALYDTGVTISALDTTNLPEVSMNFPQDLTRYLWVPFLMPNDWNGGAVTVIVHSNNAHSTAQQYRIRVAVNCVADNSAPGKDLTDAVDATVSGGTGTAPIVKYWTVTGVTARNCTAGLYGYVTFGRIHDHADDTSTLNAQIHGIELRYVSNQ